MLEFIRVFPLLSVCIFVVISISLFSIFLRRSIYVHLMESAKKIQRNRHSGIIDTLKDKFQKASNLLENVNTTALIDSVYSEETFEFFGLKLHCEKWDEFCRILPNLLLYFGLLGTFLGITLNLSSLSDIISQNNNIDINNLMTDIKTPLQGMGIAFISSLFAVFFSSILILFNLKWNTNYALNKLMSLLEDYLDNELHPSIDGYTRMDKAVNRMVEQQNEFLTRFHEKVGQVIESTMGKAADKMIAENAKSHQLAREVYDRLLESSGTFSNAATTFQAATNLLTKQVTLIENQVTLITKENANFAKVANNLDSSFNTFNNATNSFKKAAEKIEASKFSENLENLTFKLSETQTNFSQSTKLLGEIVPQLMAENIKNTELAKQIYQEFEKSAGMLQESAITFLESSETIKNSNFADKLSLVMTNFQDTETQFSKSISLFNNSTKSFDQGILNINNSVTKLTELSEKQLTNLDTQSTQFITLHNSISNKLNEGIEKMVNLGEQQLTNLDKQSTQFIESQKTNHNYLTNIAKQLQTEIININKLQETTEKIVNLGEQQLTKLETQSTQFIALHNSISNKLNEGIEKMVNLGEKQLTNLDKYSKQINLIQTNISSNLNQSIEKITKLGEQQLTNLDKHSHQILEIQKKEDNYFNTICHNLQQTLINMENLDNSLEKLVKLETQKSTNLTMLEKQSNQSLAIQKNLNNYLNTISYTLRKHDQK